MNRDALIFTFSGALIPSCHPSHFSCVSASVWIPLDFTLQLSIQFYCCDLSTVSHTHTSYLFPPHSLAPLSHRHSLKPKAYPLSLIMAWPPPMLLLSRQSQTPSKSQCYCYPICFSFKSNRPNNFLVEQLYNLLSHSQVTYSQPLFSWKCH